MTDHAHAAGPDHVPHVLPLTTYFATFLTLVTLTAITIGVSYIDLGSMNLLIALVVATLKATTVSLFFMHLAFDHKFHALIFGFSLIFLAIFIWFTMYDTETRGRTDAVEGEKPVKVDTPFVETQADRRLKEHYGLEKPPTGGATVSAPALSPPR